LHEENVTFVHRNHFALFVPKAMNAGHDKLAVFHLVIEGSRTTTQWESIAKRTICLAWPKPHTWITAAIKSPSVISFLCFVSIRQK